MADAFEGSPFKEKIRKALQEMADDPFDREFDELISQVALRDPSMFPASYRGWFGPYAENMNIQVPKSQVIGFADAEFPVGSMLLYGAEDAPVGWLVCNGSGVSRSSYAALFAAIGTTYGVGDGSTTFNVPDLRGQFPIGQTASGDTDTLGNTGGSFNHVHTGPSHTHDLSNHVHSDPNPGTTNAQFDRNLDGVTGNALVTASSGGNTGAPSANVTGSGGTGNTGSANPPFLVVTFIIKY